MCAPSLQDAIAPGAQAAGPRRRVLMVASEAVPLAKTGGLADVCGALPMALGKLGCDVRLLLPGYPQALDLLERPSVLAQPESVLGVRGVRIIRGRCPGSGIPVHLVDCAALYAREGSPYVDREGRDWPDNALRFGVLSEVAVALAAGDHGPGWRPEVLHCHDWQTGLVPLWLRQRRIAGVRSVFTVHNAGFQGNFPMEVAEQLGLAPEVLGPDGIEFYGQISFLKSGVRYADKVTTVSPTYAREICTPEYGHGLEGLFRARGGDLTGIINGIDTESWNPATDPHLSERYSRDRPDGKSACKADLQGALGLEQHPRKPLAIFVARLTAQKMADVVAERLPAMLDAHQELQFALLGEGERPLERRFTDMAQRYPGRVAVRIGYDEPSAHRMHAGADLLLHGARYEPCGLTQMYAMRYGTVPVVRRVGGLADTVVDADEPAAIARGATGFAFGAPNAHDMEHALGRGLDVYHRRYAAWRRIQDHAMGRDFAWQASAGAYRRLYEYSATVQAA